MVRATINGAPVEAPEGATILAAARAAGFRIPTLCTMEGLSDIGACRVCVVEVEGRERLAAACNTLLEEGMAVRTDTPRVLEARRVNVELLLSQHDARCALCVRSGNCVLQSLACDLNVMDVPYEAAVTRDPWDASFPLIRDSAKCVRCLRCVQVCAKVQGCDVWDVRNRATRLDVAVRDGLPIDQAGCVLCGQCVTHCPTGALRERDDTAAVLAALADPNVVTAVQVAPAVRTAWGDDLGISREEATEGRLVAALRALGFDYVFDTNFAADLTIMEEGSEFLERLAHAGAAGAAEGGACGAAGAAGAAGAGPGAVPALPMFTSCCPGWVRYLKAHRPQWLGNLSSAKSPQQMFGATLKEYVGPKLGMDADGRRVFCVSMMPCVAKKYEAAVGEMARGDQPDVDAVLTVRELARLMRVKQLSPAALGESAFDDPMGEGTGAAVIFGATGGVMEAALRSAYALAVGKNPDPDAFSEVRGLDGWREKTFDLDGTPVRVAVASGLANAARLLDALEAGEAAYDFVEVMACPGGCAGGGGQPIREGCELAGERGQVLYGLDRQRPTRFSHENPQVAAAYDEFLGAPLSERAHHLLHTCQADWSL